MPAIEDESFINSNTVYLVAKGLVFATLWVDIYRDYYDILIKTDLVVVY